MRKAKPKKTDWQNRIVGYEELDPKLVKPNPRNWRTHPEAQSAALTAILGEVGIVQNILVNRRSGLMVDGHERLELALKSGQPTIPATMVDLSEAEELLVLATLDPIGAMAGEDTDMLDQLVDEIQEGHEDLLESIGMLGDDSDRNEGDVLEWDASDLEMKSVFIFRAPIELQAKIRKVLQREFKDIEFSEDIIFS